jgi:hypothetical protein
MRTVWLVLLAAQVAFLSGLWAARADEPAAKSNATAADKSIPPKETAQGASSGTEKTEKSAGDKKKSPFNENLGRIHGEQPRNPRVLFITEKESESCKAVVARLKKADGEFETMKAAGWLIGEGADNDVQLVDREIVPDLAEQLKAKEYPAVCCINHGKIVRSFKSGCTTPLDAWTFSWLIKGVDERPTAPVLEAATVETTGHYPLRGNHWSVNGDWNPTRDEVIQHLRGPNHVNSLLPEWHIDIWSVEELRSLHDNLHESDPNYNPYASSSSSSQTGWQAHKSKGER